MKPFQLVDARSAQEAALLLRQHGAAAQPIARGGDLLGLLKEDALGPAGQSPSVLVNLATAANMARIEHSPQGLQLGAMCTLAQLQQAHGLPAMLHEAIAHIASPQLRAWTTLGGNLLQRPRCLYFRHPDIECFKKGGRSCPAVQGPAEAYAGSLLAGACHAGHPSDLAPALIALRAQALIVGADGSRSLPLEELYAGAASNPRGEAALASDEVLAALQLPNSHSAQAFEKAAPRPANEFAWASAAVAIDCQAGTISSARIVLGGVAPQPWLLQEADATLVGRHPRTLEPATLARTLLPPIVTPGMLGTRAPSARLALERALARALGGLAPRC